MEVKVKSGQLVNAAALWGVVGFRLAIPDRNSPNLRCTQHQGT